MAQKYGDHANRYVEDFECEICGSRPARLTWTDLYGEAVCKRCGTPYQVKDEDPPCMNIKEDWIPVLEEYWNEFEKFMGLGTILIMTDYPEFKKGRKKFNAWVMENDKAPT